MTECRIKVIIQIFESIGLICVGLLKEMLTVLVGQVVQLVLDVKVLVDVGLFVFWFNWYRFVV